MHLVDEYFEGILVFTNNDFLECIISFLEKVGSVRFCINCILILFLYGYSVLLFSSKVLGSKD